MYNIHILLAEDEERLRKLVAKYLNMEGYIVHEADDGSKAIAVFDEQPIDLAILDVMMPERDGFEVCNEIRKTSDIPVIFLTARSDEEDRIKGFTKGADDYVTKPFSTRELMARVKAILKRTGKSAASEAIEFGNVFVDTDARRVLVGGIEENLSPKEYDFLLFLYDNHDRALSREQILDRVWGYDYFGDDRVVDTVVKRLRKKLDTDGERIQTVRGVGYRFDIANGRSGESANE